MDYKWYILCASSGYENKICAEINKMSQENELIKEAFVPTKKGFKIVKGKKVEAEQKMFPSYVFVNMVCNYVTLDIIRGLQKALGFLGANKYKPDVVSDSEIQRLKEAMLNDAVNIDDVYEIGDSVRVIDGPFETFVGTVEANDTDKKILRISISIFGRATTMDIDYSKVEKI